MLEKWLNANPKETEGDKPAKTMAEKLRERIGSVKDGVSEALNGDDELTQMKQYLREDKVFSVSRGADYGIVELFLRQIDEAKIPLTPRERVVLRGEIQKELERELNGHFRPDVTNKEVRDCLVIVDRYKKRKIEELKNNESNNSKDYPVLEENKLDGNEILKVLNQLLKIKEVTDRDRFVTEYVVNPFIEQIENSKIELSDDDVLSLKQLMLGDLRRILNSFFVVTATKKDAAAFISEVEEYKQTQFFDNGKLSSQKIQVWMQSKIEQNAIDASAEGRNRTSGRRSSDDGWGPGDSGNPGLWD